MRNLHAFVKEEFGEESVLRLQLWEKNEKKMANAGITEDSRLNA